MTNDRLQRLCNRHSQVVRPLGGRVNPRINNHVFRSTRPQLFSISYSQSEANFGGASGEVEVDNRQQMMMLQTNVASVLDDHNSENQLLQNNSVEVPVAAFVSSIGAADVEDGCVGEVLQGDREDISQKSESDIDNNEE